MNKPISKWALGLWSVAVAYLIFAAINTYRLPFPPGTGAFDVVWLFFRSAVLWTTLLVAFGGLMELLDQIRWEIKKRN